MKTSENARAESLSGSKPLVMPATRQDRRLPHACPRARNGGLALPDCHAACSLCNLRLSPSPVCPSPVCHLTPLLCARLVPSTPTVVRVPTAPCLHSCALPLCPQLATAPVPAKVHEATLRLGRATLLVLLVLLAQGVFLLGGLCHAV